jgi:hypothetical protein
LGEPAKPRNWIVRAYAKVLRFLLSFYGAEPAALNAAQTQHDRQRMDLKVVEPIGPGKAARSAETVRETIDSIHDANAPHVKSGPLIAGLRPDDLIVVETFKDYDIADYWLVTFTQRGFQPRFERDGDLCRIRTSFKHYPAARAMIDRRQRKRRRRKASFNAQSLEVRHSRFLEILLIAALGLFIGVIVGVPVGGGAGQGLALLFGASVAASRVMMVVGAISVGAFVAWRVARSLLPLAEDGSNDH